MNRINNTKQLEKIAQKHDLEMLLLFGSRAEANNKYLRQDSDFDIAYLAKNNLDLSKEARLICDLMPVFKSDKIDLANIKKAGPLLLHEIFKTHKILFCADLEKYFQYQMYALRKYREAKPLFDLEYMYINNRLKKYDQ